MTCKKKESREGHRQRLKDKFWEHGLDKLTDAEVLELLLSFGTPRRDCKLTARAMLEKFGTLRDVIEADRSELAKIPGAGPSNIVAIKLLHAIAGKYLEKRLIQRDYLSGSAQVLEYLRHDLESRDKEIFKLIHLNNDNQVLAVADQFPEPSSTPGRLWKGLLPCVPLPWFLFIIIPPAALSRQKMISV